MHSLLMQNACDCSLDVTLVLIIFDMILIQYQLVPISSSFPPTECFPSKDDIDEKTWTAAAEMDAEKVAGSSLPM